MKGKSNSTLNLLLKNSFKNTVKSWPVVLGLTLLIALLSLVISLMTSIGTRVVDNYHDLDNASNLRDAVMDLNVNDLVPDSKYGQNVVENQQFYVYQLQKKYQNSTSEKKYDFYWSRTEGRNFQSVTQNGKTLTIKIVAKTTANTSEKKVDSLAVSEGKDITYSNDKAGRADHPHDVVLDATFAKKNNVKIGDIIRVQEDSLGTELEVKSSVNGEGNTQTAKNFNAVKSQLQGMKDLSNSNDIFNQEFSTYNWLQVVGFGESSDFTMPIINQQTPMPNKATEAIAYVNPHVMGLYADTQEMNDDTNFKEMDPTRSPLQVMSANDEESYYSLKFKDSKFKPTKADIKKINSDFLAIIGKKDKDNDNGRQYIFLNGDKNYEYSSRTSAIKKTMSTYETIAGVIFAVVAIIVIFSVVLVSKKQIDKSRSQIGVMKALGYQKKKIVWNYVTMPFISALVGGIIGFIIAQAVQNPLISLFNQYFNLDISGWSFDVPGFIIDVVAMWFVVTAVGFGIAYWVMRADTLELLSAAKASHISWLGMKIKEANKSSKITAQMESALLASNSGKMFSVTLVVLVATIIMAAAFTLPTVLNDNQTKSYTGMNYKQVVEYNDPIYNNPYTFMKTWDANVKDWNYNYSNSMNKITSSPLQADGNYDYSKIMQSLYTGKISSEFYDLEFGASPDVIDNGGKTSLAVKPFIDPKTGMPTAQDDGTPNALQGMTANMKMLQMYDVVLSNKYFKTISDWAIKDAFGWNILANQWPGYLQFTQNLATIGNNKSLSEHDKLVKSYLQLQNFYKKYIESVGLVVTRDYYNYSSTTPVTIKGYKTVSPSDAYSKDIIIDSKTGKKDKDYRAQIDLFNMNADGLKQAANSYKNEKNPKNEPSFGQFLPTISGQRTDGFALSDGHQNPNLPINHIYSDVNKTGIVDHYLSDDPNQLTDTQIQQRIDDYLTWYGAYFSERSGTAIVQAGFSRPPYFVQQYAKKAYYANDNKDVYRFGFSTVPFDPDQDQLGTELNLETTYKGRDTKFNMYGIQDNNRFVDLKDANGHNLVKRLFDTDSSDADQHGEKQIVVNQSLATKLDLKEGQTVNWDVLYKELQNGNGQAFKTSDWKQDNPRQANPEKGYISENDMDTFNITVNDNGSPVKFTAGNTNLTNAPSEFYQKYLAGDILNKSMKKDETFKIIGIHDGYGTPAAWIKNSDANDILQYDQAENYLWDNAFIQKFGNMFGYTKDPSLACADPKERITAYTLSEEGTRLLYKKDANGNLTNKLVDRNTFLALMNGKFTAGNVLSKQDREVAKRIETVFENAYPIFNYKYSMSEDIGDLQAAVSTWDETGGYSPIEENGGFYNGKTVNPIGQGALASLQPVDISKQILKQMSNVIMDVVIIIIVLIIILTFIIIMLTSSLIISDNVRFISTMKVLGYSTTQIVNRVLGMYAIAIVCAYIIGFIVGWFMLSGIVHTMAMASSFVLPLLFPWWLIFAVGLAVCGIYIITFAIGFIKIQKANPLDALKDMEI